MPARLYNRLHDKAWLRRQYVTKHLTMQQIADKIGCTRQAVSDACKRLGIRARSPYAKRNAKQISARMHKAFLDRVPKLRDRRWLVEQYVNKRRFLRDIAAELAISRGAMRKVFKALGIPVGRYPKLMDKKWLWQKYVVERLSLEQIGRLAGHTGGVRGVTVRRYMVKHGIPRRKPGRDMRRA